MCRSRALLCQRFPAKKSNENGSRGDDEEDDDDGDDGDDGDDDRGNRRKDDGRGTGSPGGHQDSGAGKGSGGQGAHGGKPDSAGSKQGARGGEGGAGTAAAAGVVVLLDDESEEETEVDHWEFLQPLGAQNSHSICASISSISSAFVNHPRLGRQLRELRVDTLGTPVDQDRFFRGLVKNCTKTTLSLGWLPALIQEPYFPALSPVIDNDQASRQTPNTYLVLRCFLS